MAVNVIMPAMGATQETGRLVRWLKQDGDSVIKGEMLMEVETDKSVVEVEAPASGTLARVTASPDDDIPVGQTIALVIERGEALSGPEKSHASPRRRKGSPPARKAGRSPVTATGGPAGTGGALARKAGESPVTATAIPVTSPGTDRILASPAARRLARERGVSLERVAGTGPERAVVARDVLSMAAGTAAEAGVSVPLHRMRRIIAERMTSSKRTAPHFYLNMDVDMSGVEARRNALKEQGAGTAPSVNDFILKAVSQALAESPAMNSAWTDGGIRRFTEVNVGVAVAVDEGLVVPVIRNADKLGLDELAQRSRELASQGQRGGLKPADYQGGTFTVSNLGMFGVDSFVAIINPPQCGILAVGRVALRVVVRDGAIAVRSMMTMTLSADHRVVDGAIGARFLQSVRQHLEEIREPAP